MPNLPISTHITVVSATPAAAAEAAAPPSGAAMPGGASDFSDLLAHQIAAKGEALAKTVPEGAPAAAPAAADDKDAQAADAAGLAVIAFLPFADAPRALPGQAGEDGKADAGQGRDLIRALALADPRAEVQGRQDGATGEPPTTDLPAKFAAGGSRLPVKAAERAGIDAVAPALEHAATLPSRADAAPIESNAGLPGLPAHGAPAARNDVAAPAAAQPAAVSVEARVGSPAWSGELGQKIVWLANQHQQVAHINVTPPQLGPIEIRLNLSSDQASATFVSPHAAVRDAIEAALPRLRDMLAESGLTLGNVDVSAQSFGHARQDHAQHGAPARSPTPGMAISAAGAGDASLGALSSGRRGGEGLVDLFA